MTHADFCDLFNVYETTVRNLLQFPSRHTQEQKDGARLAIIREWQTASMSAENRGEEASDSEVKREYTQAELDQYQRLLHARSELGRVIADPMWADHAEVSKSALKRWHSTIDAALSSKGNGND